jgi:hypothetical protein
LIALHSQDTAGETGLPECLPEKQGEKGWPLPAASHFLQSGLRKKFKELRGFSSNFQRNAAKFLCKPDRVAEGEGL